MLLKPLKQKKTWADMTRSEKISGSIVLIGMILLIVWIASTVSSASPSSTTSNQTSTHTTLPAAANQAKPQQSPVPSYKTIGYDTNERLDNADTVYVVIDLVDLSNDSFKQGVKSIIQDIAAKKGYKEFSAYIYDNMDAATWKYNKTLPDGQADAQAKLADQSQHLVATYEGGIDLDTAQVSTADSAYTISWYPSADKSTPNVGKYVSSFEPFKP